ncbi:undecaprenyl-diphosphate phosphatase [Cryobacterium sp. 5B3]|uniref:undecaprenyl-diphosphate phosphatase n=1 Tax=Cryobacterium sp. 5B3 TaxID=3048586 RepID=UPI002AB5B3D9|nr:undecaprenyl-diphosphate phosphatase [Cryobacterium sp. 5B3]MDY7541754.1 undecaprenyl-diphosphate phosphatase [Cryobacterium sp. 5B3]MEB0266660.1 undecaprenyl-diphosphate phosphatase [Cryobacterium sp. 10I5]MEB0275865.1 undecaprenyl-diphosphate phosphatase [Cryobacterium sp. 5B3]
MTSLLASAIVRARTRARLSPTRPLVLFLFFLQDWIKVFKGLGRSIRNRNISPDDVSEKLGWLLVIATIPAGILGLALEKHIRALFASPVVAAGFLVVNGLILFTAERLRSRPRRAYAAVLTADDSVGLPTRGMPGVGSQVELPDGAIARLTWLQGLSIRAAEAAALIPGISRSGSSMVGGVLSGLDNQTAARFSFLLATPIIGAAAALKLPGLFAPELSDERGVFLVGSLCSAAAAWFATKFLLGFFETRTLKPFAIYCVVADIVFAALLLVFR